MSQRFPSSFAHLGEWSAANNILFAEARRRFAQFAILSSIGSINNLRELLIFKGGNALDFIWSPNRSTTDLDFSTDYDPRGSERWFEQLRDQLDLGLRQGDGQYGLRAVIQSWRQFPLEPDTGFAAISGTVGYALPDEPSLRQRMSLGRPSTQVIPLDISINDPVCAYTELTFSPGRHIRVAILEDIVAEKLRALLQQSIRNRYRGQDVLDLAVVLLSDQALDVSKVRKYLVAKSAARGIALTSGAYMNADVRFRALQGYENLAATSRDTFVPFDPAFEEILSLVERLDLPG